MRAGQVDPSLDEGIIPDLKTHRSLESDRPSSQSPLHLFGITAKFRVVCDEILKYFRKLKTKYYKNDSFFYVVCVCVSLCRSAYEY